MTGVGGGLLGLAAGGLVGLATEPPDWAWLGLVGGLTGAGAGLGVGFWPAGPVTTPGGAIVGGVAGGLAGAALVLPACAGDGRCRSAGVTGALVGAACGAALGAMLTRKPRRRFSVGWAGTGVVGRF